MNKRPNQRPSQPPSQRYDVESADQQADRPVPRRLRINPRLFTHLSILIVAIGSLLVASSQLPAALGLQFLPPVNSVIDAPRSFSLPSAPATPDMRGLDDDATLPRGFTSITTTHAVDTSQRQEITHYTVREGDTLFGIAIAFGLNPETILWSNYKTLKDNPDMLSIGQELTIPPLNGLIAEVEAGDTIDAIARRFKVEPGQILNSPVNGLDDINQQLSVGRQIFVPDGQRETVIWQVPKPIEVRRTVTGVRVYKVGTCGEVAIPQLGSGGFIWPANRHYLSGYNFSAWHAGVDIAGRLGEPIYAADSGTVIYAGYSLNAKGLPVGYGQYVVLDHGNGYQTLYAHASQLYVRCGDQVRRGAVIAAVGSIGKSTGPHLHFEIRAGGGALNPLNLLQ